ncbi:MAG: methionyl-tRNA formyltransferase [Acidimicrobiia bacterium]
MTRIAFLGTPGAAVPTLRALAQGHEIAIVITQPDRARGRGRHLSPPPVKAEAKELGIDVAQPESSEEIEHALRSAGDLDLGVVVAYGRILKPGVLGMPTRGMLNVHFSLLPRWRGAAPVARALMDGDPMSGVTIIRLDEGLDTGPVLTAQGIDVEPGETAGELTKRLAEVGARLLANVLPAYMSGDLEPVPQSDEGMTYAAKIEPGERAIEVDGEREAEANRVRALSPEPGAVLVIDGEPHQVLRARLHRFAPEPGTWQAAEGAPVAGLADGGLELVELLPPGKRPMSGEAWLRGRRRLAGTVA